jgi:hypothetical protein
MRFRAGVSSRDVGRIATPFEGRCPAIPTRPSGPPDSHLVRSSSSGEAMKYPEFGSIQAM